MPILFPEYLEEGQRTSAMCSVTAGEPPISIKWYKDGVPLNPINHYLQISTVSISEFLSNMIIERLERGHRGEMRDSLRHYDNYFGCILLTY